MPVAAGVVACEQGLSIANSGTLRLFNVTADGDANCTLAVVEPGATAFCKVGPQGGKLQCRVDAINQSLCWD